MSNQVRIALPERYEVDREAFDAALSKLIQAHEAGTYFVWALTHGYVRPINGVAFVRRQIVDAFLTHSYNVYHPGAGYIKVGEVTIE